MLHLELDQVLLEQDSNDDIANSENENNDLEKASPSQVLRASKNGYKYQAAIFFGANKDKAIMSFDTSTSFTTVTSTACSNCKSQAYHLQEKSSNNRNLDFELQFD